MRMVVLVTLLCAFSCTEKEPQHPAAIEALEIKDSTIKNFPQMPIETENRGRMAAQRRTEGDTIFRNVQASQLPLSISERLESEQERFILEIENFKGAEINAELFTDTDHQNLRFNQVLLNGEPVGGPYGRKLRERISHKGKVEIIVGKNLMAEGTSIGSFRIEVK